MYTDQVDGSTESPPDGWDYDPGDPMSGLRGGWAHYVCPLWPDGTDLHALFPTQTTTDLGPADTDKLIHGRPPYLYRITCACGAAIVVTG